MVLLKGKINKFEFSPPRVLALGFLILIFLGAFVLNLPIASKTGVSIGFVDALFTSASASCVTGLAVVNTAEHWSIFGQIIILLLIQIGGLGIMTMATVFALISGKKISLRERLVIKEQFNQDSLTGLVKLTKYILYLTLMIETVGAIMLSTQFIPQYGTGKGIWFSIFHSISAFCNAGFDITGDSLMSYTNNYFTVLTMSALIIIGGIGFSVILDAAKNRKWSRLSIHTKLVLLLSFSLVTIGAVSFFILEFNNQNTIGTMNVLEKIVASFFASVTPRTAGFNSIDTAAMRESSAFLTIILMFIGGSPGSTAGGIKTATFGVIVLSTIAIIKGERDIEIYKKRISLETIYKSLAIVVVAIGTIILVSFILTITEEVNFLDTMFEATSAFATVGLSRGLTSGLSTMGKLIIIFTMFAGRVGPLTMAFAFGYKKKHKKYRYSEGHISVG